MARSQLPLRLATFLTGLLECIAFSGLIFGWTSLVFVLKSDHYFQDLCEQPLNRTANATGKAAECSAQDSKFSLIFTLASFANNFVTFPTGYIFDRLGTTVARLIAIFLYTGATLLVAISSAGTAPMLFAAFPMLAVGGILFLLTNLQVGNLFGKHRSTIITLYNGAFDSSSAIFLIIKLLYERGLPLRVSFFILCAFSIFHLFRTFFLMPRGHIPYPVPSNYTYGISCSMGANGSQGTKGERVRKEEEELRQEANSSSPALQETAGAEQNGPLSFRSCILSWRFFWHLVWMSVMQLWHYLFIGTLNPMLNHLSNGNQDQVSSFTNAFAITQLFGVLCAPWNGFMLDRLKKKYQQEARRKGFPESMADLHCTFPSLALTSLLCLAFSICASIPILKLQYFTFILQVISRSFLFGGNAAFITLAFPSQHFGKIYGTVMMLSAVVTILQFPIFILIKGPLQGNPLYVNIVLILFTLLSFVHPFLVSRVWYRQGKHV